MKNESASQARSKIDLPGLIDLEFYINEKGCWISTSRYKNEGGYPMIRYKGKLMAVAHFLLSERHNITLPRNIYALHKCDVPACINPAHIYLGTQKQNIADCILRGRRGRKKV